LAGATEAARQIYSSWAGDRELAEASRQEDARRTRNFFF
jgi:hypothetical protein